MQAGRELDELVEQHVMDGDIGCFGFRPSTSILDAWQVVEKLTEKGNVVKIDQDFIGCTCSIGYAGHWAVEQSESAPQAICLAALKAVGVDIERGEKS